MAAFPPLAHVAVTVSDLARSGAWYDRLFGQDAALDEQADGFYHRVYLLGTTLFGLHTHPSAPDGTPFDPTRPGLDHVAFGVGTRAELEEWASKLDEMGIAHGGIVDQHYGSGVSFKDPDGLALEIFAPPAA